MERKLATLERGTVCSAWNYSAQRLASASINGYLSIFDSPDPASSSSFSPSSSFQVCPFCFFQLIVSILFIFGYIFILYGTLDYMKDYLFNCCLFFLFLMLVCCNFQCEINYTCKYFR